MRLDARATPDQASQLLLDAGCAIVFTSAPELSATYALDAVTLDQIGKVALAAAAGLNLPLNAPTFTYPDLSGTPRTFNSDQLQALFMALRDYIAGVTYYGVGRIPSPPAQPVVIT